MVVNSGRTTPRKRPSWNCYGCGSTTPHPRHQCPALKLICYHCNKIGHFTKVCRQSRRSIQSVDTEINPTDNSLFVNIVHLKSSAKKHMIPISINGKKISSMLVDITVFSQGGLCEKLDIKFQPISCPQKAVGVNGNTIEIVDRIANACFEVDKGFFIDTIWVAEHLTSDAILGHSSLSSFQALTINYGGHLSPLQVQQISSVSSGYAECKPVSCFPAMPTTPIRASLRRYSPNDSQFMKTEVRRLLLEAKIQQSNSSWRSQAFMIRDKGNPTWL